MKYDDVWERIDKALDGSDWSFRFHEIRDESADFIFEAWSPSGEDLPLEGTVMFPDTAIERIIAFLDRNARTYDADEHVELWINERGKNGVPSTVRELVDDAEEIGRMYWELLEMVKSA